MRVRRQVICEHFPSNTIRQLFVAVSRMGDRRILLNTSGPDQPLGNSAIGANILQIHVGEGCNIPWCRPIPLNWHADSTCPRKCSFASISCVNFWESCIPFLPEKIRCPFPAIEHPNSVGKWNTIRFNLTRLQPLSRLHNLSATGGGGVRQTPAITIRDYFAAYKFWLPEKD